MIRNRTQYNQYNGMMKMSEAREELSKLLGYKVTVAKWQYYRKLGIAPDPPPGNKKNAYVRYISMDDVNRIYLDLMTFKAKRTRKVKYRFRQPGVFRQVELCGEIEDRLGIDMPKYRIRRLIERGVIPEGKVRLQKIHGGLSMHTAWTDQQVEEIIASLSAHYKIVDV